MDETSAGASKWVRCPRDRGQLEMREGGGAARLRCASCGAEYPLLDGIPSLLPPREGVGGEPEAKAREATARDLDAPGYDATVSSYQSGIEVGALMAALDPRPGEVVLDLGAGTGRLTCELAKAGATVLATDLSPKSLALNRKKCAPLGAHVHWMVADACQLPLADRSVDKVLSAMVLEHVPTDEERRRCVAELARVLKPGGRAALTVYNRSWRKRGQPREGFHGKGDLYYYRFDAAELRKLLAAFEVKRLTALLSVPSRWGLPWLDRAVSAVPPLATLSGELLLAVASPRPPGAMGV